MHPEQLYIIRVTFLLYPSHHGKLTHVDTKYAPHQWQSSLCNALPHQLNNFANSLYNTHPFSLAFSAMTLNSPQSTLNISSSPSLTPSSPSITPPSSTAPLAAPSTANAPGA